MEIIQQRLNKEESKEELVNYPPAPPENNWKNNKKVVKNNDRHKCLRRLGVTENDIAKAEHLLSLIPPCPNRTECSTKLECVLGYSEKQIKRAKALTRLGVSEDELEVENSKTLGSLGKGARRRSFSHTKETNAPALVLVAKGVSRARRHRNTLKLRRVSSNRRVSFQKRRRNSTGSILSSTVVEKNISRRKKSLTSRKALDLINWLQMELTESNNKVQMLENKVFSLEGKLV
mmetsp:Transcript_9565/g.14496  ORF Transcript_9565/g.14496 Transcript_9565/m.14496 type:complete len:233 (-) Transcript_9565:80-778(-)